MLIRTAQSSNQTFGEQLHAEVLFEGRERRTETCFVATDGGRRLSEDLDGFLVASFLPAWMNGDASIRVDGSVCRLLVSNLRVAASVLSAWYPDLPPAPRVECVLATRPVASGAGIFISGGVDSLAAIRTLVDTLPPGHPDRPTMAALVDYQDIGGISREETDARFRERRDACQAICDDVGLQLATVSTNLRRLNTSMDFWRRRYHGAFLAAMAQFLSPQARLFYISATYDSEHLVPWGSQPLLDPNYSSRQMRICHVGHEFSRFQKTVLLGGWPLALERMNVCTSRQSGGRNCGRCEKCLRTKVQLLATGHLSAAGAFLDKDVSVADIRKIRIDSQYKKDGYLEVIPHLMALGRRDLAEAVETAVRDYSRRQRPKPTWRRLLAKVRGRK